MALVADGPAKCPAPAAGCVVEGSVYNLSQLAASLEADPALGPERLLSAAFERWGEGMLDRLRGGFALVAWADSGRRILVAQDQVGICSIFLHRTGDRISFASEIRDLLPLLERTPDPDEAAVVEMLSMRGVGAGRTAFTGVCRLGAGRRLSITDGRVDEGRYWLPAFQAAPAESRLESAARLRNSLLRATALRVRPGERVGITLSGGLDSSVVAAATLSADHPPALHGYSAVFDHDSGADDERMLDSLSAGLAISNVRYRIEPGGALALGLAYLRDWKLPLSGPGLVTEYRLLRRAAADGVEVLLDGQGGDELFGVAPFLIADRLRAGRVLSAMSLVQRLPGAGAGVGWGPLLRVLRRYGVNGALPAPLYSALRRLSRPARHAPPFLSERAAAMLAEGDGELDWIGGSGGPRWWLHLRHLLVAEREAFGLGDYIRHRASWVGVEGRPPLFDVELIELALRTAPELAFDPYIDRPLVREAMAGRLPDRVRLSGQKSNLAPFYLRGLSGPDLPLIRELLGSERLGLARWVPPETARAALNGPPDPGGVGWERWLSAVWGWLKVESWLRSLSDPAFAERFLAERRPPEPRFTEVHR
jgi:asparagine synthase (glutamine-hydrolysing)